MSKLAVYFIISSLRMRHVVPVTKELVQGYIYTKYGYSVEDGIIEEILGKG